MPSASPGGSCRFHKATQLVYTDKIDDQMAYLDSLPPQPSWQVEVRVPAGAPWTGDGNRHVGCGQCHNPTMTRHATARPRSTGISNGSSGWCTNYDEQRAQWTELGTQPPARAIRMGDIRRSVCRSALRDSFNYMRDVGFLMPIEAQSARASRPTTVCEIPVARGECRHPRQRPVAEGSDTHALHTGDAKWWARQDWISEREARREPKTTSASGRSRSWRPRVLRGTHHVVEGWYGTDSLHGSLKWAKPAIKKPRRTSSILFRRAVAVLALAGGRLAGAAGGAAAGGAAAAGLPEDGNRNSALKVTVDVTLPETREASHFQP